MKFIVSRTSDAFSRKPPCNEAKRDKIVRVDTRTFPTPEEFDLRRSAIEGKWFDVGTNHRIDERGYITRDNGTIEVWTIELNSLVDLIDFCDKYGDAVIQPCCFNKSYKEIEIYDDYRE